MRFKTSKKTCRNVESMHPECNRLKVESFTNARNDDMELMSLRKHLGLKQSTVRKGRKWLRLLSEYTCLQVNCNAMQCKACNDKEGVFATTLTLVALALYLISLMVVRVA